MQSNSVFLKKSLLTGIEQAGQLDRYLVALGQSEVIIQCPNALPIRPLQ